MQGQCYINGHGTPKNLALGMLYLGMAVSAGSEFACYVLGMKFQKASDVPQDDAEAAKFFRKIAFIQLRCLLGTDTSPVFGSLRILYLWSSRCSGVSSLQSRSAANALKQISACSVAPPALGVVFSLCLSTFLHHSTNLFSLAWASLVRRMISNICLCSKSAGSS